ncbi:tetratricopeptide repeat protein [Deinococcus sp. PESE-13]
MTDLSAAWAAFEAQDYALAEQQAQALLAHPATASRARFVLGYVYAFTDRFDEARASFQALRQHAQKSGDPTAEHRALHQVGMVERMAGNWDGRSPLLSGGARIARLAARRPSGGFRQRL